MNPSLRRDDWAGEMGDRWLANLDQFESMMQPVGQALLARDIPRARDVAQRFASVFAGRFYIELQRGGLPAHEAHVQAAVPLAAELGLPVVATHPVQFLKADDFEAHEARVCVAEGDTLEIVGAVGGG